MSDAQITGEQPLILVYGPSGVGKTTAFQFAEGRVGNVEFESLDEMTAAFGRRKGFISESQNALDLYLRLKPDGFLATGIQAANELLAANVSRPVVLDVGAGFLESRLAGEWLSRHICVLFKASPEVAYRRLLAETLMILEASTRTLAKSSPTNAASITIWPVTWSMPNSGRSKSVRLWFN